ncbi:Bug family tripartite tricarboxylate transporter substrate binding protein [Rubritepida flocculans]|uniref:Bug family tripartite tricarboxylate transporter substrate binding protein n=1 Tax=Rubritepida flocculans TaxID=182403 RepID=UPI0004120203|nr:tripartite tricarboxylate transporter substrate-binding protein [Rubritepida flocculans]
MRRRPLLAAAFAALPARAQERAIRLVIAFPPGGSTDLLARLVTPGLAARLGVAVTPENRSGASGAVAAGHVALSPPDGATLLMDSGGQAVNPHLLRGLAFDYARDLAPVALLARLPLVLVARAGLPVRDLAGLLAWLRAHPAEARYGSVGIGARTHLAMAALLRRAGIAAEHIPYRGGAEQIQGLLRGDAPMGFTSPALALPLLREGRLLALAVSGAARSPLLPGVPSLAEQGVPGVEIGDWIGLLARAGTPASWIARVAAAALEAVAAPDIAPRLAALGLEPAAEGPEGFARFLAAEREAMGALIAAEGIRLDG